MDVNKKRYVLIFCRFRCLGSSKLENNKLNTKSFRASRLCFSYDYDLSWYLGGAGAYNTIFKIGITSKNNIIKKPK